MDAAAGGGLVSIDRAVAHKRIVALQEHAAAGPAAGVHVVEHERMLEHRAARHDDTHAAPGRVVVVAADDAPRNAAASRKRHAAAAGIRARFAVLDRAALERARAYTRATTIAARAAQAVHEGELLHRGPGFGNIQRPEDRLAIENRRFTSASRYYRHGIRDIDDARVRVAARADDDGVPVRRDVNRPLNSVVRHVPARPRMRVVVAAVPDVARGACAGRARIRECIVPDEL